MWFRRPTQDEDWLVFWRSRSQNITRSNITLLEQFRDRGGFAVHASPLEIFYEMDVCMHSTKHCWNAGFSLRWRHDGRDIVSNHQPHDCLLGRVFRRRSKKTSKLRVTGLCAGNSPGPVNSPHKWPATRKMFPFDDVIMYYNNVFLSLPD